MLFVGFAITAPLTGHVLDPFSNERLILVTGVVCALAFSLSSLAVWGVEDKVGGAAAAPEATPATARRKPPFREAISQIWDEPVPYTLLTLPTKIEAQTPLVALAL